VAPAFLGATEVALGCGTIRKGKRLDK